MTQQQDFHTIDVLRLQVEDDPVGLVNLIRNSSGELGVAGWSTPIPGSRLTVNGTPAVPFLEYLGVAGIANHFYSDVMPVVPGQYVAASWVEDAGTWLRARFEYLDAEEAVISAGPQSGYYQGSTTRRLWVDGSPAPAAATGVRLRYDVYGSNAGALPGATTRSLRLRDVRVGASANTGAFVPFPYIAPVSWVNVIGSANRIGIDRAELDLGNLNVDLVDADLDPAKGSIIRPGRQVRLQVWGGNFDPVWHNLFVGEITNGTTTYDFTKPDGQQAQVKLTAVDATAALANAGRPEGVSEISELAYVLEGTGVPYIVDGATEQIGGATIVAVNDQATAIDQVAITRDTHLGYAWVDRNGWLNIESPASMADRPPLPDHVRILNEEDYQDPAFGYDTDRCINEVTINVVSTVAGETTETKYGPYRHSTWSRKNRRASTFTVYDKTEADVKAHAASILAANGVPQIRCSSLVLGMVNAHLDLQGKARLDLYDEVTVINAEADFNDALRIVGVSHEITATEWLITLTFAGVGSVAPSQVVPSPTLSPLNMEGIGNVVTHLGTQAQALANNPGHLLMHGGVYSAAEYPKLYAHLGTTALPNMTNRHPKGAGDLAVGSVGGNASLTLTAGQIPALSLFATGAASGGTVENNGQTVAQGGTGGRFAHPVATNGGAAPAAVPIQPPYLALWFLIRAK